jgi:enterochelin esterase-like enzyme
MPLVSWDSTDADEMKASRAFLAEHPPLPDPNHREHWVSRMGSGRPDMMTSLVSLRDAPDESLAYKRPDVPHGWIDTHSFASARMGNERRLWVYIPPGYKEETRSYPVLVVFDGGGALADVPVQRLLDNLLAQRRIAPQIAVLIDNPTETSRNDELPCNENFALCIEEELLPWLEKNYRVSRDAADRTVTGMSYGGLAAIWMGFRLPHIFGNVIAQAASLWWGPGYRMDVPRSAGGYEPEWLIAQYEKSPRLPVRFWMESGLMEHPSLMIEPNRRLKAVLESKDYDLRYSEPAGGHDSALWRVTLGQALAAMLPLSNAGAMPLSPEA